MNDRSNDRIRVLIVDDERLSRERLRVLLEGEPDVVVVGQCENGLEALDAITALRAELVFLDVQMPDLDGLGVIDALGCADQVVACPEIVFVTAYNAYMERAFEVHAVDYLRKPYTDARFAAALAAARRRVFARRREALEPAATNEQPLGRGGTLGGTEERASTPVESVLESLRGHRRDTRLAIQDRRRGTWDLVPKAEIDWIAVDGDAQVRIHAAGKDYAWRKSLGEVERILDEGRFLRVHRSYLVNGERIRQVKTLTKGEYALMLADGTVLDTGRSYRGTVEAFLRAR